MITDNGWLSPDGRFYECDYTEHWTTAEDLVIESGYKCDIGDGELTLEKRGWVKRSDTEWYCPMKNPTQSQLDVLLSFEVDTGQVIAWLNHETGEIE
jgi:hypothetical protein